MSKLPDGINRYQYETPRLPGKIRLYLKALMLVPLYRYGETGNIVYTVGRNLLDGIILYTMFSMAEKDLKVAAVLGVAIKYAYPGISLISTNLVSGFIDRMEAFQDHEVQISRLVFAHISVGTGQSLGAICLVLCYPPFYRYLFYGFDHRAGIIILLYLLHHVLDGAAQMLEGRTWFRMIEIRLRNGENPDFSKNFWVIYSLSQNFHLLMGQLFLWSGLWIASCFEQHLTGTGIVVCICSGLFCVVISKFILPFAHKFNRCNELKYDLCEPERKGFY